MRFAFALIFVFGLFFFGCTSNTQSTQYVCSNGIVVSSPSLCPSNNSDTQTETNPNLQNQSAEYNSSSNDSIIPVPDQTAQETLTITGVNFIPSKVVVNTYSLSTPFQAQGYYAAFQGNLQVAISGSTTNPIKLISGSNSVFCTSGICNLPITNSNRLTFYTDNGNNDQTIQITLCINNYSNCQTVSVNRPSISLTVSNMAVKESTQTLFIFNDNSFEISGVGANIQLYDSGGSNIGFKDYSVTTDGGFFTGMDGEGFGSGDMLPGGQKFFTISSTKDLGQVTAVVSIGEKNHNFFSQTTQLYIKSS